MKGKVGVTTLPAGQGGVAAVPGAWYLSIPNGTAKADLAKKFIQFAYDHNELGLTTSLGLAARKSALQSYASKPGHENLQPMIDTLNVGNSKAVLTWLYAYYGSDLASLDKNAPRYRAIARVGSIYGQQILGGLHHRYARIE